jgi:hypothetical protein
MRNAGIRVLGDSETVVRNGNWIGNDTCWRMALDLNRCLLYGNPDGSWRDAAHPKPYLSIVDGVVSGEGNGPLCPDPIECGLLVAGTGPAEVDAVVAKLMGFDPARLPVVIQCFADHPWPISRARFEDLRVFDGRAGRDLPVRDLAPVKDGGFRPHFGWTDLFREA